MLVKQIYKGLNSKYSVFDLRYAKRKKWLHEDFDIAMTEEYEVRDMCDLSRVLVEQGIEQGIKKEKLSLAQMMIEEKEPVEKISKYTGFAADKLKEIAAAMGQTLV